MWLAIICVHVHIQYMHVQNAAKGLSSRGNQVVWSRMIAAANAIRRDEKNGLWECVTDTERRGGVPVGI